MGAASGIWFRADLVVMLSLIEQQARRDKTGDRLQGTHEALGDLRRALGLDERASHAIIDSAQMTGDR